MLTIFQEVNMKRKSISRAELARQLGVSRTYITLLAQGKRKPSQQIADKLNAISMTSNPLGGIYDVFGGFDSHALPPTGFPVLFDPTPIN